MQLLVANPYKPIPNAKAIVKRGEMIRLREASVAEKEQMLLDGTTQLEAVRMDIQLKLPPAVAITNMLASEAEADSSS